MKNQNITVYTTKTCQQCRLTEARMAAKGLDFRIIRLENEPSLAHALRNKGFREAPVVQVTGDNPQIWSGFRPDLIETLANP